ncbi:MAG: hypothetical protein D6786_01215 [Gammaproteobacteria bacterium]|nr:MAG: hypothetical protein D6786_01215 [Gammaproteobacteria bacterium]
MGHRPWRPRRPAARRRCRRVPAAEELRTVPVRLDSEEQRALHAALAGIDDPVYLFGSRTDEGRRGGDIDILVLSKADPYQLSKRIKRRFFENCEEKIDVVVMDPERLDEAQRAFLESIDKVRLQ